MAKRRLERGREMLAGCEHRVWREETAKREELAGVTRWDSELLTGRGLAASAGEHISLSWGGLRYHHPPLKVGCFCRILHWSWYLNVFQVDEMDLKTAAGDHWGVSPPGVGGRCHWCCSLRMKVGCPRLWLAKETAGQSHRALHSFTGALAYTPPWHANDNHCNRVSVQEGFGKSGSRVFHFSRAVPANLPREEEVVTISSSDTEFVDKRCISQKHLFSCSILNGADSAGSVVTSSIS